MLLNHTLHGSCAHGRVIALFHQPQPGVLIHLNHDLPFIKLRLQFSEEFIRHRENDVLTQWSEGHDGVETVSKLGRESAIDRLDRIRRVILHGETNGTSTHVFRTGVGRHHQDHVPEVGFATVIVGESAVIHDLQQQVKDLRMRLFNLVQQHH